MPGAGGDDGALAAAFTFVLALLCRRLRPGAATLSNPDSYLPYTAAWASLVTRKQLATLLARHQEWSPLAGSGGGAGAAGSGTELLPHARA